MERFGTFTKEYIIDSFQRKQWNTLVRKRTNKLIYNTEEVLSLQDTSKIIRGFIDSGRPFMAGRFGANELSATKIFDFKIFFKYKKILGLLHDNAGVFPETKEMGYRFANLMIDSISQLDLIAVWNLPFERYYLNAFGNNKLQYTQLRDLEPWSNPSNPWSYSLRGKKVLVVHPFEKTIKKQFLKNKQIFVNSDILPNFELSTLKSVQSVTGESDPRFDDWFSALYWMRDEILSREFDIAILGCGAYGFPLAAEIKKAGKQAIHLGGATQLLFGIMGTRWEKDEIISQYVNDNWVRPSKEETPLLADNIENGCYW